MALDPADAKVLDGVRDVRVEQRKGAAPGLLFGLASMTIASLLLAATNTSDPYWSGLVMGAAIALLASGTASVILSSDGAWRVIGVVDRAVVVVSTHRTHEVAETTAGKLRKGTTTSDTD